MKDTLDQYGTNKSSLGFTLIEIMIVLAVIGVLTVVTIPKYQAFRNHYQLESAAQIVTNDLRLAKQLAMDRREMITVNLSSNSISVSGPTQVFDAQAYEGGINSTMVGALAFDYHGFITAGSVSSVDLNKGGMKVTIYFEAQTGNTTRSWL